MRALPVSWPDKFIAVGDVIPTRSLPKGWRPFGDARLVFCDLETPFTRRGVRWDKPVSYRADPSLARELANAGFGLVSLANNQVMNYGRTGLTDTMDAIKDAGLPYIGAGPNLQAALAPHIVELGGARLAVIGLTCVAPRHWNAGADQSGIAVLRPRQATETDPAWAAEEPGVAPTVHTWVDQEQLELATSAVERARKIADLVVVAVHWGVGSNPEPAMYQRQLGVALVEAGAALVLGSHPPPLQGFERIGTGLISYSLGTFIRQQPQEGVGPALAALYARMPREAAVLELSVENRQFSKARVHPVVLDDDGIARPVGGEQARRIIRTILNRSVGLDLGHDPGVGNEPEILTLELGRASANAVVRQSPLGVTPGSEPVCATRAADSVSKQEDGTISESSRPAS